jgi:adenylate cyclase
VDRRLQVSTNDERLSAAPEGVGAPSRLRRFLFALAVLTLLCLFCAPLYFDNLANNAPAPRNGFVSYAGAQIDGKAIALAGEWRLVWAAPSLPRGPKAGDTAPVRVPGGWSGVKASPSGAPLPMLGRATYELTLHGLPAGPYTLFVPTIAHASRVFVNGRLASASGRVGDTAARTRYNWRSQRVSIDSDGGDIRLAIEVAVFHHVSAGLDAAPVIGPAASMEIRLTNELAQQLFFISTLIILFFYGAVVFSFRSRDYPSLCFGLACLFLVPTAMVIGHEDLLTMLYPALSFGVHMGVEYLTCIISFMFLIAYAGLLFPRECPRWTVGAFVATLGVLLIIVGATVVSGDTLMASQIDRYPLFVAALELMYMIGVVTLATIRGRDGAAVFLLGISVFALSIFEAILVQYEIVTPEQIPFYDFAPMGLLVFCVSHIIILAERWSTALSETEATAADLRRLMEVSSAIASEVRLDVLLKTVVETTSKFLHADRSSLFLHDPKTDELWSMVAEGMDRREIRMPAGAGIAGAGFLAGEVTLVPDAYKDPRFNREVDAVTGYRTRAILTAPIITRDGRRLGVMQALNRVDGRPFEAADIDRIRAFAAQAAVAIDNANLFSGIVAARNYNESILASMSGGVITLNEEGRVETINAAAARILEVDGEAVKGVSVSAALSNANGWLLSEFEAVRADGAARAMLDVEIINAAAARVSVNLSIVPLINEGVSAGLLVLFEDISQEKRLKGAMRRFMTQKVVDQVLERQDELMFGSACVASVLFADIRGFTAMAESLKARETVDMLNEVFADLVEAVSTHDGVVDKFIGDAVMAVFGAPISSGRDPQNAVESANAMMRMIAQLNLRRQDRDEAPLRLGIGVSTGELIAGTIGSPKRMDYTVIGDSVNLASRLQDLTKGYGVGVVLCEATALANAEGQVLRRLDTVGVRGRNRPETIFQLMTYHSEETFPRMAEVMAAYEEGLVLSEAEDWRGAAGAFAEAHGLNKHDKPSLIMLERTRAVLEGRLAPSPLS